MSINSLSLFEILTSLTRLSEQLRLRDKAFPITYILGSFYKSTTTGVVEIEMVPIYHTSGQTLRHIYFSIIAYYPKVVNSLHGVNGSLIRNVLTEFGIYISEFFLLFSLYN